MKSLLTFIVAAICYGLSFVFGYKLFGKFVPKGKGFEVGSVIGLGIMIIMFTIEFWYPSVINESLDEIVDALAVGLGCSLYYNDRKQNKTKVNVHVGRRIVPTGFSSSIIKAPASFIDRMLVLCITFVIGPRSKMKVNFY